ncbi:MAG: hypothetical protein FJ290_14745 [Planctomycetes bacterium]|nr:hypothetical protein [Planctomycetota bacterium]
MAGGESGIEVLAIVGTAPKNAMQTVRARLVKVRGRVCADLRCFAMTVDGEQPMKAGFCVSAEGFPAVAELVRKLARAAAAAVPAQEGTSPRRLSGKADSGAEAGEPAKGRA